MKPSPAESEVLDCLPETTNAVAEELGINASSVRGYLSRLRQKGYEFERDDDNLIHVVRSGEDTTKEQETATTRYAGQPVSKTHIPKTSKAEITRRTNEHLYARKQEINRLLAGTPPILADGGLVQEPGHYDQVYHLTDLHIGAWQRDEYLNDVFSIPIAIDRVRQTIRHGLQYKRQLEDAGYVFDTGHVLLGGDTVDGENIYNHHPHEVETTLDKQIDVAEELLIEVVETLAREFPTVQVICQSGNHGEIRAQSMSEAFNADSIVYSHLEKRIRDRGLKNVTFVRNESTVFTNFRMRVDQEEDERRAAALGVPIERLPAGQQSGWRGHLRHGDGLPLHIGTSSPRDKWGMYAKKHDFDVAYRGHWHEFRVEPIHGVPVIMGPSITESPDYEDAIGVNGVPGALTHIVGDDYPVKFLEPLTFERPAPVA